MSAVRASATLIAGFALLALVNAVAIATRIPLPSAGISLRLLHHAFDAAETLGLGLVLGLGAGAFVRFVRLPPWGLALVGFGVAVATVLRVAGDSLLLAAAHIFDGRFAMPVFVGWIVLYGVALMAAPAVAAFLERRRYLRLIPLAVALIALALEQLVLPDDYFDFHGITGLGAVLVGGIALGPRALRCGRRLAASAKGRIVLVAITTFALLGVVAPPPNAVRCELFRQPCALAPWVLATVLWQPPRLHAPVTPTASRWLEDRSHAAPLAPTSGSALPPDAVVLLVTVDALRPDVVLDPANKGRFPTFARLEREGVDFSHASAPGTQTGVSLTTLFSSRYSSELFWQSYGEGLARHPYAAQDPAPRFPALLAENGVVTTTFASVPFLTGRFGTARGFDEETVLGKNAVGAPARRLTRALLDRLSRAETGRHFLYAHFLDPHAPAHAPSRAQSTATRYSGYLDRIGEVDLRLGQLLEFLEQHFGDRWALFVTADHGEAFGDHQTTDHGKTLYEELEHVPLLARSPRFPSRRVDERVGLIDLGPTILDLFGVPTPATFEGESVAPLLFGRTEVLTRPILAEARFKRSLTEPDGLKVIEDLRRKLVEVYDLARDPHETRNIFDVDPARSDLALAELRTFFTVHARHDPGYAPPYKP